MDAIILAGGFGTRLRPLTLHSPKPLVPLANQPFLATLTRRLARAGVRRANLAAFHQCAEIRRALARLPRFGVRLSVVREPAPLGTGGAIRHAWPDPHSPCLVLNGDILSDFDLADLARFHRARRADASLWTRPVEDPSAFGVLEFGRDRRVRRFVEKPRPGESDSRFINAGVYVLSPSVHARIPEGRAVSVEREVFPGLVAAGLNVSAFVSAGPDYWRDLGTPQQYLLANLDALKGRLPSLAAPPERGYLAGAGSRLDRGCRIESSVLGPRCRVGAKALVSGSVLWEGCRVGEGARLEGALLGRGVEVGAWAQVGPGAVLGDGAVIPPYSKL